MFAPVPLAMNIRIAYWQQQQRVSVPVSPLHVEKALLFSRDIPSPREPLSGEHICAGLAGHCCSLLPCSPQPSWWCCSAERGCCGARGRGSSLQGHAGQGEGQSQLVGALPLTASHSGSSVALGDSEMPGLAERRASLDSIPWASLDLTAALKEDVSFQSWPF